MFEILVKRQLNQDVVLMEVKAPLISKKALPGQFIIFRVDEKGERVPLTIADTNEEEGSVTIIFQTIGKSTKRLSELEVGDVILDFVGPLGKPTHVNKDVKRVCVVGGGVGCAIGYPQAKYLHNRGYEVDIIAGFRNKDICILEEEMKACSSNLYITTDDGSYGEKGFVTDKLRALVKEKGAYDLVIAIGPLPMMKFVCLVTKEFNIKTLVSLNPIMIDGTGMCGGCRVKVDGVMKFACVDGPDFDGHSVDFDELMNRNTLFRQQSHDCNLLAKETKVKRNMAKEKVEMPMLPIEERITGYEEVALGYTEEMAIEEARRCLNCKNKPCVYGCPVNVEIPSFIEEVALGNFEKAYKIVTENNSLPAVCGRVCPQETQCEELCVRKNNGESVGIGRLERFVADWYMANKEVVVEKPKSNGKKVAILGAGPSGLTCAGDLAKMGYKVTIFEAFHTAGGVLVYGIPEFRLPKEIVKKEIEQLEKLGVEIKTNMIVGRILDIEEIQSMGYDGVYIATGAGLPSFMGIEGEGLVGVYSANEYLTRINLMKAYLSDYDTPIQKSKNVAIIGGGNVAMDASRCAKRVGAENVYILYRRDRSSMPARLEEIHHAEEEGVKFKLLVNPVKIIGDEKGAVKGIECVKMEVTGTDDSGRTKVEPIEGSNFVIDVESVIMSIGNFPNPLVADVTKGLEKNAKGGIVVDNKAKTSLDKVYAGGDATVGAATVIYAMGSGKTAAKTIDEELKNK